MCTGDLEYQKQLLGYKIKSGSRNLDENMFLKLHILKPLPRNMHSLIEVLMQISGNCFITILAEIYL